VVVNRWVTLIFNFPSLAGAGPGSFGPLGPGPLQTQSVTNLTHGNLCLSTFPTKERTQ
jgi:hypothetical protein